MNLLAEEGIKFVTGAHIGQNYPTDKLRASFDAIVLCGGATAARDLTVEGRNLGGVHFAMEFLLKSCKSLLDSNFADGQYINAKGKNVIVIGGGDTGTDCVGTSLRHGCKSLVQFEILPRPPTLRADDNPWPQWPRVYKLDYGQEEAAALFGADPRQYVTVTKGLVGDSSGSVKELHTVEVEWVKNGDGRFNMKEKPGSERVWPAELVLLAMGFVGPEKPGLLDRSRRGARRARQRHRRRREGDQRRRRLRGGRHGARPVADRLGDCRRSRRRPRRRSLSDGRDVTAVAETREPSYWGRVGQKGDPASGP